MADHDALLKKALVEIRSLKSKLEKLEGERAEPIAILGMGCRLQWSQWYRPGHRLRCITTCNPHCRGNTKFRGHRLHFRKRGPAL